MKTNRTQIIQITQNLKKRLKMMFFFFEEYGLDAKVLHQYFQH